MTSLLDEAVYGARKQHHCCVCEGTIGIGDTYHRQRLVDGRDAYTVKFHNLCDFISRQAARDIGYWPDEGFDAPEEIWPRLREWFGAGFLFAGGEGD